MAKIDKLEQNQEDAIRALHRLESRFHAFNTLLIVVAATSAVIACVYYVRRDNDRTRNQINCVVQAFLLPDQSAIPKAVNNCKR